MGVESQVYKMGKGQMLSLILLKDWPITGKFSTLPTLITIYSERSDPYTSRLEL